MPDTRHETAFIKAFILPERRDRYAYFLAHPTKRKVILGRLYHQLDFIPNLATQMPSNQHTVEGVLRLLAARGIKASDPIYIISAWSNLDAMTLPLHEALNAILTNAYTGSVVSCIAGRLAYYCPEEPAPGYIFEKPASPNGGT